MENDITKIAMTRSLIDLDNPNKTTMEFDGFVLKKVFDDIICVEYVDENENAEITRNGLFLPGSVTKYAWRKGKVVLTGQGVELCKPGDIVVFPNDKGIIVSNIEVENYGMLRKGAFLNERRIFGILGQKNV